MLSTSQTFRQRLPTPYRDEQVVISALLSRLVECDWTAVVQTATPWVRALREQPPPFWAMESLLKEYPLSTSEGLALMRLAEALLRVPDTDTAMALTADQLSRADFEPSGSAMLARLSSAALALAKQLLPEQDQDGGLLGRLGARGVVTAALRAVQLLGRQFVLGQTISEAMAQADQARAKVDRLLYSYDMLGEGARTDADALRYLGSYQEALAAIAARSSPQLACEHKDGMSIKLSALHPRFEDAQHARLMAELLPRAWALCEQAARAQINLTIDAEEADRLELTLDVFEALAARVAAQHPGWRGLGLAVQAYQSRSLELVQAVIAIGRHYRLRLMVRLVKGAYWDFEIKRAQELGLPHYPVFTHKHHTDVSYLACAQSLLAAPDVIYAQLAGHNAGTIAAVLQMAERVQGGTPQATFELQRLHGMGEGVFREVLAQHAVACRVYAPVGAHRDLLAYLVRRLLENGANSSFVHQLVDPSVAPERLLASPLHLAPEPSLPWPADLYADRRNSSGLDLSVEAMREPLLAAWASTSVPTVAQTSSAELAGALSVALQVAPAWRDRTVTDRADILRRGADALQAELPRFAALLVKEAFKTWGDAVAEVREAVDFLRYYASQAQQIMQPQTLPGPTGESNVLRLRGRGVWVCISPWNFPLAIFLGQAAAALATGNAVLAKPAEQTPAVALQAAWLLHRAGVPASVLQVLHGPGETVGAGLVAAPGIAGVVFTGSTAVARLIYRSLAAKDGPIVPLIAETGGINAMCVDSSALPEQVTDAVLQSAFRSAGQRCSALRLLCLHAAIADPVLEMLAGAVQQLRVGDPAELSTDVGPLIDEQACAQVRAHVQRLHGSARAVCQAPKPAYLPAHAQMPIVFEIPDLATVKDEIFGPVLQVLRWGPGCALRTAAELIDAVNALGYGLTLGLQTRIDTRALSLAAQARIGNVYVNRNMIGAVVGVQPFGGEGLSGTGPKAGGPHYLARFCSEQTLSINTTAAGGNVALLMGLP